MRFSGEGKLLRIFIGESDRAGGKPLYQALVELARREGLAGATVIRGIEGFGASSHLHTSRILRLSEDLPVVVEIADTAEHIERILPAVDEMVGDGMITIERVEVLTYRGAPKGSASGVSDRLAGLAEEARALASSPDRWQELELSLRAAREDGASEEQIAGAAGIPLETVRRILGGAS